MADEIIDRFDFKPGRRLAGRYEVVELLGAGWESEVYLIRECATGIERAAKVFFPARNRSNRQAKRVATRMHALRDCPAVIQYVTQETVSVRGQAVTVLVSEFVEGELLSDFIASRRGKRLPLFEALHLLHTLADALEPIHSRGAYHGDLHAENVLLRRLGIRFEIRLIDMQLLAQRKRWSIEDDVWDVIKIFYDALGGRRHYRQHPAEVKQICRGMKRSLIAERFRNAGALKSYLERFEWQDA